MNKAEDDRSGPAKPELFRVVIPMPKSAGSENLIRRPLRSLRKSQASGMPFLPLSR